MDNTIPEQQKDHDLLIEINTVLKQVVRDIQDLKDGTSVKIADHEKRIEIAERWRSSVEGPISKVTEHEGRISTIEKWRSSMMVYLSIYGVIGGFIATLLIYHLMGK